MTAIVIRNSFGDADLPEQPVDENGAPFDFELIFGAGKYRAYSNDPHDFISVLIPRYDSIAEDDHQLRLTERILFAARAQTILQADLLNAATAEEIEAIDPGEWEVLHSPRATPPRVAAWTAPVPLVLLDIHYQPIGDFARPEEIVYDNGMPSVLWLSPADEWSLLVSMHECGMVMLSVSDPEVLEAQLELELSRL